MFLDDRSSCLPSSTAHSLWLPLSSAPAHSHRFPWQSLSAVSCPHSQCFDVTVVRRTFCRATEVPCRLSPSLSLPPPPLWSYRRHASHHATSSCQDSHCCQVAHGGAPCCNHLPDGKPPVSTTMQGSAGRNGGGRRRRRRRWGGLWFDLPFFCLQLHPTPFQGSSALAIEYMNSYEEN